jgi:hypothetical protein
MSQRERRESMSNQYHFSFGGEEGGGAVGLCLDVIADSEAEAVTKCKEALELFEIEAASVAVDILGVDWGEIRFYTYPKNVSASDIDDIAEGVDEPKGAQG